MTDWYFGLAVFLLVNLIAGLFRILRGPTPADGMLAAQLFGTTGVAVVLLLSQGMQRPALRDVALVFSLLATVATVAFIQRTWNLSSSKKGRAS
jgi:multicomponent Na+:H+ antiporter subunit F